MTNRLAGGRIFVSYAHTDIGLVEPVCERLTRMGHPIWLDQRDIEPGQPISKTIDVALQESVSLVAFIGPSYFEDGRFTSLEFYAAINLARSLPEWRIVPVLLDKTIELPPLARERLSIVYYDAAQVAGELSAMLSRNGTVDGGGRGGSALPVSITDFNDLDLRLILKGFLDQRAEALRQHGETVRFRIALTKGRTLEFAMLRDVANDPATCSELEHLIRVIEVSQRFVDKMRGELVTGLLGKFEVGFEIMLEEHQRKLKDAHSTLTRQMNGIIENATLEH